MVTTWKAVRGKTIKKVKKTKASWVVHPWNYLSQCSILLEKQRPSWNSPKATASFH